VLYLRAIMKTLAEMVGETTLVRSAVLDAEHPQLVKLVAVETGNGIWVECQKITDHWLAEFKLSATPRTLVWFLPFSQISWIVGTEDYPALSEKSFGV
jgi:hypothetical protein